MVEEGVVRWAFNFGEWTPSEEEWQSALSLVEKVEQERIGRFRRPVNPPLVGRTNPDAKSALIGRLLMRLLVHKQLNIPFSEIIFARTKENKPYLVNKIEKFPNFNFNVSHAGSWVVLGSEPEDLIGVDVMDAVLNPRQTMAQFFENMTSCFTKTEWQNIKKSPNQQQQIDQFFRHWCLKESYIKAVGIGLGFELQRAQFTLDSNERATSATIAIDGKHRAEWRFDIDYLGGNHITACALGPPAESIGSFKDTLPTPNSAGSGSTQVKHVPFQILKIEELVLR